MYWVFAKYWLNERINKEPQPRLIPVLEKSVNNYVLIFWCRDCSGAGNKMISKTEPAFEEVSGETDPRKESIALLK